MRASLEGKLAPDDPGLREHLDACVGCRACEPVCPAGVEYGTLLEHARAVIRNAGGTRWLARVVLGVFEVRAIHRALLAVARVLRRAPLGPLARLIPRAFPRLRLAVAMLATSRAGRPGGARALAVRASPASKGRVALLEGCVQRGLLGRVNAATRRVLQAHGYECVDAPEQGCCGALHAHSGDLQGARNLARRNIEAFERAEPDRVAVNSAGCAAAMKAYGEWLAADPEWSRRAASFSARASELFSLLDPADVVPGRLPLRVLYDAPCHLRHGLRAADAPARLLATIPGIELVKPGGGNDCCGAGGIYGLLQPRMGLRLLADKLTAIRAPRPDVVVTANPGCMLHIGAGFVLAGERVPVLHPVELLDESYGSEVGS